jgi:hypothetical protein
VSNRTVELLLDCADDALGAAAHAAGFLIEQGAVLAKAGCKAAVLWRASNLCRIFVGTQSASPFRVALYPQHPADCIVHKSGCIAVKRAAS